MTEHTCQCGGTVVPTKRPGGGKLKRYTCVKCKKTFRNAKPRFVASGRFSVQKG